VYRAHDTKLGRDVAIKVVSAGFARDPERVARFQREAQLLAALNHPNIASVHGLDEADPSTGSGAVQFLVMELVEGGTLADRLNAGAIPVTEALPIARQVADALQAAHEKGIVHRDLKPANIAITAEGQVKVLDFGLAKALGPASVGRDFSPAGSEEAADVATGSPTLTLAATQAGVILGTAAYMAPEQAKGRAADKRSDIWSFGCVLYEMLAGKRAFDAEDLSETLAAVLMREPDWHVLPAHLSPQIVTLLKGCLEKDRRQRFADMSVAQFLLSDRTAMTPAATSASAAGSKDTAWRRLAGPAAALVLAGVMGAVVGGAVWFATRPVSPRVARFPLTTASADALSISALDRDVAITPDGSRVVYVGRGGGELLVRSLDQIEPISLARGLVRGVFVAPDGQWVGFIDNNRTLKKVAITGGPALTVTALDGGARGATWAPDETIVFATNNPATGLQRVSAAGGEPAVLTRPNRDRGEADHLWPEILPGGRSVLFTITATSGGLDAAQIAVLDLETGAQTIVLRGGSHAHYVSTGHLLYVAAGALRGVAFDSSRREVRGTPVAVLPRVTTTTFGAANYAISADGTLAYVDGPGTAGSAGAERTLVWVDRTGREEPLAAPARAYNHPRLSPDGTRVVLSISSDQDMDLWMWDLRRETLTRLTFAQGNDWFPLWTPDGRRIVFSSAGAGGSISLFWIPADGTGKPESLTSGGDYFATGVSPDGTQVVLHQNTQTARGDLLKMSLGGDRRVEPILRTPFDEQEGTISPDGRWIAYESDSSGGPEIYVRPFPEFSGGLWQVSTAGGRRPLWARDGRELFYLMPNGVLTRVPVEARGTAWKAGTPVLLLQGRYFTGAQGRTYDVSPDGRRFLMIKEAGADQADARPQIIVVQNWVEELKRLVPIP
jgi:tRNA A-37 threonylcarbamoyl transferase component Bud32